MIEFISPVIYWLSYIGDILCSFMYEFLNQSLTEFSSLFGRGINNQYFTFTTFFYNSTFIVDMNPLGITDIINGLLGEIITLMLTPANLLLGGNAPLFAIIIVSFIFYTVIFAGIKFIYQSLLPFQ